MFLVKKKSLWLLKALESTQIEFVKKSGWERSRMEVSTSWRRLKTISRHWKRRNDEASRAYNRRRFISYHETQKVELMGARTRPSNPFSKKTSEIIANEVNQNAFSRKLYEDFEFDGGEESWGESNNEKCLESFIFTTFSPIKQSNLREPLSSVLRSLSVSLVLLCRLSPRAFIKPLQTRNSPWGLSCIYQIWFIFDAQNHETL